MDGERPRSGFVLRAFTDAGAPRFCVLWRPRAIEATSCGDVRAALAAHRDDLLERLTAVRALLASDGPERADRAFTAAGDVEVTELVLAPGPEPDRFAELMRRAYEGPGER